jgi:transposase
MKKHKNHHRKFKRYWKLILKSREDLDFSKWKKFTCFNHLMTESDVVNFLINLDDELKQTYLVYQDLLYSFKNKNYSLLCKTLNNSNINISSYMKTSIKTLKEFLPFIKNTFNNNYHNGFIEGNNNFIKVRKPCSHNLAPSKSLSPAETH